MDLMKKSKDKVVPKFTEVYKQEYNKIKQNHLLKHFEEKNDYFQIQSDQDVKRLEKFVKNVDEENKHNVHKVIEGFVKQEK